MKGFIQDSHIATQEDIDGRWSKPKYKVIGKRLLNTGIPEYLALLDKLALDCYEYTCNGEIETIRYLWDILRIATVERSVDVRYGGKVKEYRFESCVLSGWSYKEGVCISVFITETALKVLILARDSGDPFLQKEYTIIGDNGTKYITSNWYVTEKMYKQYNGDRR